MLEVDKYGFHYFGNLSTAVHCAVQDKNSTFSCCMTFLYGFNASAARMNLWDQLRHIREAYTNPWVVLGDFNTILSHDDRLNGEPVTQ